MAGCLHSLNSIFLVDFINENYTNIGAFHAEHLYSTLYSITGEKSTLLKN